MIGFLIHLIVFVGGAAVLALEILGTRILGPYYGVSLLTWSTLITVTLLALSVGYALGGRLADRRPSLDRLAWIPGAAGLWTAALPWIRDPVLAVLDPLGLRGGLLVSAFILFVPPLTLLGMIGPYAIRLSARRIEEVGRAAGRIYALSTLASVASALATGFYLIPGFGVRRLTLGVGVALILTSAWAVLASRRSAAARGAVGLAVLAVAASGIFLRAEIGRSGGALVDLEQSAYGEVRVLDRHGTRYLLIDGGIHTAVDADTKRPRFRYVRALDAIKMLFERPGRALVVGLGGGSAVRSFTDSHWTVDSVEVDPVVARFAAEHFDFRPAGGEHALMDGRRYLEERDTTWDLILLDAYGSGSIPFHLATAEFFALVKSRLAPGGIVVVNVFASAWEDRLVRSVAVTLGERFETVLALPTQEPPNTIGSVLVVAADRPMEIPEASFPHPRDYLEDEYAHWSVLQLTHAWDNRFVPNRRTGVVLTDDRNPADLWFEPVHVASRRELLALFGRENLLW